MSAIDEAVPASEEQTLGEFGYDQELKRVLRQFALFAVAFSIISITTGIFLNFGFAINSFGPASIWLWLGAAVGQMLVALVLAELGTRIPLAGANYQWGARLVSPDYGWFVGSIGVIYNTISMPGIMLVGAAPLAASVLGLDTGNDRLLLFIGAVLLIIAFMINIVSVQVASRVNNVAVATEILGIVVLAGLIFVLWVVGDKSTAHDGSTLEFLFSSSRTSEHGVLYSVALAALIGIYTIVGFETTADMAEEAVDARRAVPRGMILAVGSAGFLGMLVLIGFTVATPNLQEAQSSATPLVTIAEYWIGTGLTKALIALVVFSMFALVVAQSAANARLVYALARDNMLPGSGLLKKVNPDTLTPVPAILLCLVISLLLMGYGYLNGDAFLTLIGAAAIAPYIVYLLTVIAYGLRRSEVAAVPGTFNLGRFAAPVFGAALVWVIVALACLTIPGEFRNATYVTGGAIVLAAVWYVFVLRQRIRDGVAGSRMRMESGVTAEEIRG